jgi:hypothetical protein
LINIHLRLSPRGTLIYEKNLKSKISCQTPFKRREKVRNGDRLKNERERKMETDVKEREYGRETDKERGGRARE